MRLQRLWWLSWVVLVILGAAGGCKSSPPPAAPPVGGQAAPASSAPITEVDLTLRRDFSSDLTMESFDTLHESRPGVQFVKVVVVRGDLATTDDDQVFFLDPTVYKLHIDFVYQNNLVSRKKVQAIQTETWQSEERRFFFVNFSRYTTPTGPRYVLELFEQDRASAALLAEMMKVVTPHTFTSELAFKPNSIEQASRTRDLKALGTKVVENDALSAERPYLVLHVGKPAVGRLRVVTETDPLVVEQMLFNRDEIVLLSTIPNDITRVAGVITTQPTTPLSHVNLRAITWDVPNVMIRGALDMAWKEGLEDAWVHLAVGADGIPTLRRATQAEIDDAQARLQSRPTYRIPRASLAETRLIDLYDLRMEDVALVGAKAANLGEVWAMRSSLTATTWERAVNTGTPPVTLKPGQMGWGLYQLMAPPRAPRDAAAQAELSVGARGKAVMAQLAVPEGFAIPFGVYRAFLQAPGNEALEPLIRSTLSDKAFQSDPQVRRDALTRIRTTIKAAKMPQEHRDQILDRVKRYFRDQEVFVRSSTNAEDLSGFNGAGLYDTVAYIKGDDAIIAAVQQVWASIWNFKAFEAREDAGIDHLAVYPGVLIQVAIPADVAGVMMTRDIFSAAHVGRVYINANPGPGSNVVNTGMTPEQIYVDTQAGGVSRVSLSAASPTALLPEAIAQRLAYFGGFIEAHFAERSSLPEQAQDVEWVYSRGELYIVQARPWIYRSVTQ